MNILAVVLVAALLHLTYITRSAPRADCDCRDWDNKHLKCTTSGATIGTY